MTSHLCQSGSVTIGRIACGSYATFDERCAMILGMNGVALRESRPWRVYLWKQSRHWAVVVVPSGQEFTARAVDDFLHGLQAPCNMEVLSTSFYLVYEIVVPNFQIALMLSVKPDFDPARPSVICLGDVVDMTFDAICTEARHVVQGYRCYSLIGSNCQHFSKDFASKVLGTTGQVTTEDDDVAASALRKGKDAAVGGAAVVTGCVLTIVAPGTTVATASAATASQIAFGSQVPVLLAGIGAGAIGLAGAGVCGGVALGYCVLRASLRQRQDCEQLGKCKVLAAQC